MPRVRVLAFARVRELLESGDLAVDLPDGATVGDAWARLVERSPALAPLAASTRIARNGRVVGDTLEALREGDELALLPPVGGG